MLYNSGHVFHQVLSSLEEALEETDSGHPGQSLRALIDLLLISFAKAESMSPPEQESQLEQLRMYWGNFLLQYIRAWRAESPVSTELASWGSDGYPTKMLLKTYKAANVSRCPAPPFPTNRCLLNHQP